MLLIIVGVLMLIGLVVLHELGHFIAARRAGIEVEEFGIGFPPQAKVLKKKNGTEYTLNWLPLGGFVKLKGEHDSDTEKGSFGAARLKDKILVMVAGVAVNAVIALLLLTIIALVGLPKVLENQFTVESDTKIVQQDVVVSNEISEESAAFRANIKAGDRLLSVLPTDAGSEIPQQAIEKSSVEVTLLTREDVRSATSSNAGQLVRVQTERKGTYFESTVRLESEEVVQRSIGELKACEENNKTLEDPEKCDAPKGYLGIVPAEYIERRSTWSAPIVATVFSAQIVQETLSSFGKIFSELARGSTETAERNVTGVVGIGYILGQLSSQGFMSVLFLVAIISLSLAIMNALPIPALDGGRLFVTLLFRAIRKPLTESMEERIHGTGFALLMLLFVLITIVDVRRFII